MNTTDKIAVAALVISLCNSGWEIFRYVKDRDAKWEGEAKDAEETRQYDLKMRIYRAYSKGMDAVGSHFKECCEEVNWDKEYFRPIFIKAWMGHGATQEAANKKFERLWLITHTEKFGREPR